MDQLIVKHYYTSLEDNFLSDFTFAIYKNYKELFEDVLYKYSMLAESKDLPFKESNILIYRCGSVSSLGEFRIYSNPLPIYINDIKEMLKND